MNIFDKIAKYFLKPTINYSTTRNFAFQILGVNFSGRIRLRLMLQTRNKYLSVTESKRTIIYQKRKLQDKATLLPA